MNVSDFFARELLSEFRGHRIAIRTTLGAGALRSLLKGNLGDAIKNLGEVTNLYVDEALVASSSDWILFGRDPILSYSLEDEGKRSTIEVYARAGMLKNLIKVHVDGKRLAGDNF